ncbi:MAG: hypothetical protein WKF43_17715 [Acidimicrobiales bacterium]
MSQDVGSGKSRRGRPVEVGGALVTLVEPHRGHEVAYNRWYERDHFYAGCMIGAWTLSGARFVCTRDLKALRYPADSPVCPDATSGSYLALYWILNGRFGDWITWSTEQVKWLIAEERMFPHRDHIHTLMYRFRAELGGTDDTVPVELALDHRSSYVVMVVGRPAAGVDLDAVDEWFRSRPAQGAVTAEFTPVPMHAGAPSDVPRDEATDRFLQLCFVDEDIHDVWDDRFAGLGEAFAAAQLGELLFVSPFRATVPGTDTYSDQLW